MGNEDEVGTRARGNEDEGERERGGTYRVGTGSELSRVNRSCVRTGSDRSGGRAPTKGGSHAALGGPLKANLKRNLMMQSP